MYRLFTTTSFDRAYKRIIKRSKHLLPRLRKAGKSIRLDPFQPSLRTHKAESPGFGTVWSSKVTGDLRIIWRFEPRENKVILLLAIGGHSGKHKVYK